MRVFLFVLLAGMIFSCKDPGDHYVKRFEMVDISKVAIPDTIITNDYLQIVAKARADDRCWSHLYFELKKTREFEYTLKAYGTYESFGVCAEGIVYKDSSFTFQAGQKGTYHFIISNSPDETKVDSLVVIE